MSVEPKRAKRRAPLRRTSENVRDDILAAATELFAERGFAGTTTLDIARRAGVAERLIFRKFENKAGVFAAAVSEPIMKGLDRHLERIVEAQSVLPAKALVQVYVDELFHALRKEKRLIVDLLVAEFERTDKPAKKKLPAAMTFQRHLQSVQDASRAYVNGDLVPPEQLSMETRLIFAMILGAAVFDKLLFDEVTSAPERQIASIVKLAMSGAELLNEPAEKPVKARAPAKKRAALR